MSKKQSLTRRSLHYFASSAAEQAAAGCHWAFFGIIALVIVTALGIALFAKDK